MSLDNVTARNENQTYDYSDNRRENGIHDQVNNISEPNFESDIIGLVDLRNNFPQNPIISYLNINSLRNKIFHLWEICDKAPVDILCIDETKIDPSFPDSQFHIDGYQFPPFRKDRDKNGGGKIVYVKNDLIAKRIDSFEGKNGEFICLEITISKKKWCVVFAYRPPRNINKNLFFKELSNNLNQITNKYENFMLIGDLNVDTLDKTKDTKNYFSEMCDTFSLTNLINGKTCFKSYEGTSVDVMLTNRPRSFYKTGIYETGISDHHKMILTLFRSHYAKLPPKTIEYRDYKRFYNENFLHDLDQELLKGEMYKGEKDEMFSTFFKIFRSVLDRHAPLKSKK